MDLRRIPKWIWGLLLVGGLVGGAVAWNWRVELLGLAMEGKALLQAWLQKVNPWAFFAATAILPSVGVPLTLFYLAMAAFVAAGMGFWFIYGGSVAALSVGMLLAYVLGATVLRPVVTGWLQARGKPLPKAEGGDAWSVALMVRLTPGFPFTLQNLVLPLAGVPLRVYLPVSIGVQAAFCGAFLAVGESLFRGGTGAIVTGGSVFVILLLAIGMVRRHVTRRQKAQMGPSVDVPGALEKPEVFDAPGPTEETEGRG